MTKREKGCDDAIRENVEAENEVETAAGTI